MLFFVDCYEFVAVEDKMLLLGGAAMENAGVDVRLELELLTLLLLRLAWFNLNYS